MKEMQEWLYDEGLSDCPFCGETAQRRDESGRIRWNTVRINHTIKRSGWAEILPEDQQYRESYAVCCGNCGGSGGHYASIEWAAAAWNRRVVVGDHADVAESGGSIPDAQTAREGFTNEHREAYLPFRGEIAN